MQEDIRTYRIITNAIDEISLAIKVCWRRIQEAFLGLLSCHTSKYRAMEHRGLLQQDGNITRNSSVAVRDEL
jgi:hypothetical protein